MISRLIYNRIPLILVLTTIACADDRIRIASFNIENFGKSKITKDDVVDQLAAIFRKYDLIAVQEVSNKPQRVPYQFLDRLNQSTGDRYGMLLSERSGRESDDQSSQEQYAFYYNTRTVHPAGVALLYDDSGADDFQREPFVARFESTDGNLSFVLITVHTDPDTALGEIRALRQVNDWCQQQFPLEDNFITVGDYNAGARYVNAGDLAAIELRQPPYEWFIGDDADTTLGLVPQAHDRIVVRGPVADHISTSGVDRAFPDDSVSDHWPIFLEISIAGAAAPSSVAAVRIASVLPDPSGSDLAEEERVVLRNDGDSHISLEQWRLRDSKNKTMILAGTIAAHGTRSIPAGSGGFRLRNTGDTITLLNADGVQIDQVDYAANEVIEGASISFPP